MLCLETLIRQNTSHLKIYTSPNPPTPQPPTETGYDYICQYVISKFFFSFSFFFKSNGMVFISHCCESRMGLKISTHILHFPCGHHSFKTVPTLFSFSFLHRSGHFSSPHLYKFTFFLAAVGMGPDSIEFQLPCKLGYFQFFI